jgi:pimeloyl-ACP methyl ester carboxylesterase
VFFKSYREVLEMCELRLNTAFYCGQLDPWWKQIVGVAPSAWQASPQPPLQPLEQETLKKAVHGCWFPVHAMGYNWLQSNQDSGVRVAKRITALMNRYREQGFQCEKVIVVTHSMGGLVARALIHPEMGKLQHQVLGIVHGVMPAIGAGAAYKRMRCGFEDPGVISTSTMASLTSKVLGNYGREVTAVLGNAQGGLELLPSQAYGNDWLQITHKGLTIKSLPEKGDPYEEIYKLRGKWYGLLREEWINPARQLDNGAGFERTIRFLDRAKKFHNAIASTYHDQSYAHYGADPQHAAWHHVEWKLEDWANVANVDTLVIADDNSQGRLRVVDPKVKPNLTTPGLGATLRPAGDPGDQTVPLHSAEHQLRSGKFKGVFRQTGYEHQDSYNNERALHATLYSLVRIAQTMTWTK